MHEFIDIYAPITTDLSYYVDCIKGVAQASASPA